MLRTLSLAAPVVAAIMIVVLIVEPPALRPAERLPTLRMLTARAAEGLDQRQVQDAIARGREGAPGSYVLHRVLPTGDQPPAVEPAGVVYTPFLRVAWAAHARQSSGRPLTPDEVPAWMAAPVFYVVLRTPSVALAAELGTPALAVVPADTATCCLEPQPTLVRSLWMSDDPTVTTRFGATTPFSDLGVIAAYPVELLRSDLDFVAFYRVNGPDGPSSVEMRGRLEPSDLETWR
ncbi:MAG: hypothetical protein VX975_02185 [Acidobacteriota bacterium]|nr:hypothetical protein [Acidobacteriota bacterium]